MGTLAKDFSDLLSIYAKILVTYTGGIIFFLFASVLFIEKAVSIPIKNKLIFFGIALFFLFISYLIRHEEILHFKLLLIAIWLGNVFGFLFNIIYVVVKTSNTYGYNLSFGGIEKYIFYTQHGNLNMIESMYGFVGAILFIIIMSIVVMYGLSLRDKFKKENRKLMMMWGSFVAVMGGFAVFLLMFLSVGYYQNIVMYLIYSITGSMLFIYGTNLFKKHSGFLKF